MIVTQIDAVGAVPMSITRKTKLASLNVNGLLTRTKDEFDTYRVRNVAKFLHST